MGFDHTFPFLRGRPSFLVLGVVSSIALHGLWWWTCAPGRSPWRVTRPAPAGPQVIYATSLPADAHAGAPDLRVAWSPAVFSLPTPLGFSGGQIPAVLTSAPPLMVASNAPHWLARAQDADPTALDRPARLPERAPPAQAEEARVFTPFPAPTGRVLYITWYMSDGRTVQRTLPVSDAEAGWVGDKAWEAVLRVERETAGGPERVLIETATPSSERNRGLLRGFLNARTLWPGNQEARVRIRFDGLTTAAPAASAGAP